MSLAAAAFERAGIPAVTIAVYPDIMKKVGAPRWLETDYPFGLPFGAPGQRSTQRRILCRALGLLGRDGKPPVRERLD